MRRSAVLILAAVLVAAPPAPASQVIVDVDHSAYYGEYRGCHVRTLGSQGYEEYGDRQCFKPLAPCSSFKVPNSLIGLETGVIPDADHVIAWDGTEHRRKALNRDHDLRSAIRNSVLWYYQELARRVGAERMQEYVSKMVYGNMDVSGGLTEFWLGSSLEITAYEQVSFFSRLRRSALPFSERSMAIVREIIVLEETEEYTLRGKTGSCRGRDGAPGHGWFAGYVTRGDEVHTFATSVVGEGAWGAEAKRITLEILKAAGVM